MPAIGVNLDGTVHVIAQIWNNTTSDSPIWYWRKARWRCPCAR